MQRYQLFSPVPLIRQSVSDYFQQPPKSDVDPDEVVAMGAAIHAASLTNADQDSFLLDVTPLDLRIGVVGGLAEPVIEANTPVPIEQTRVFTTVQDNQEVVKVRVYQGGERAAEDNEMLGEFEFSGFKQAPRGGVQIEVTFEINSDGIVNVTAREPESGQEASTHIALSSGLSEEELEGILEEARTDRVQTADVKQPAKPAAPAKQARPAPAATAPADELELLDEADVDLDLVDDDELASLASNTATETIDPDAISVPELDGSPDEQVPMETPGEAAAALTAKGAPGTPGGDTALGGTEAAAELFDTEVGDLAGDDEELG